MKNIIIGAGPAGVTAAYELSKCAWTENIIIEKSDYVGGISATLDFNGNKVDLGPHRFFTKSDRVQKLWETVLPLQGKPAVDDIELEHNLPFSDKPDAPDPATTDNVLLFRPRLTRIYYHNHFFDYPISFSVNTIVGLGLFEIILIGVSYAKSLIFKRKEKSLEDFFINRFGKRLYLTFFKEYTEKLWGVKCSDIPAEWGAQRVKGISIIRILKDILGKLFLGNKYKTNQTSLIEAFYYPKFGAGQMYEQMLSVARQNGIQLNLSTRVEKIKIQNNKVASVVVNTNGTEQEIFGDNFISSMPVRELIEKMDGEIPQNVREIAKGLPYRNVRLAAFLLKKLKLKNTTKIKTYNDLIPDVWIYIQETGVKAGRMEIINNFSPYLVENNKNQVCITVEYFCSDNDDLWKMSDNQFLSMALSELIKMNIVENDAFLSQKSFKIPQAYPAYFGTYKNFSLIKDFLNSIVNLYPVGRNGMHKYNNMDHSILTALETVDFITKKKGNKANVWNVNTEQSYHEGK